MHTLGVGVGTGTGLGEPVKHPFICTLSFFAAVKFNLTDRMVKLDWVLSQFLICESEHVLDLMSFICMFLFSFQHVEGPECQLYRQLRLHAFASCFVEWTQVSLDLLECFIGLLLTAQGRLGAWFNLKCQLWCHNGAVNLYSVQGSFFTPELLRNRFLQRELAASSTATPAW